jgi:hypothetical protein
MRANSCEFLVKDGSEPVGKLTIGYNIENKITWRYTDFVANKVKCGFVHGNGGNYELIRERNKKIFAELLNFSLSNFNSEIRYSLISNKHPFFCTISDYAANIVPNNSLTYYFPLGRA